ncbi:uncharacterized protein [Halyomorpha halys]|uniref:uncharacterized protein n=1 Tax=Halyomorpha halys TaxID=286706 RepID=UPI000D0C7D6E|nr:uncharacterized protein LOC112211223 [Halyomorpha halys]
MLAEECLQSVSVSICEDVSITPFPIRSDSLPPEAVVISPVAGEDVTLNPVQFAPHFLSHEALLQVKEESAEETEDESPGATPPRRRDLLEYLMNEDGTVVCKRCGELLPSRTQWYRHKYKFHIESPPAALFKCYRCNVFFKSRKGYLGHLSTRHSRVEEKVVIPCRRGRRGSEDISGNPEEYEKQREKEEKLVADIIDRVKRECEAQGSTVSRKGYSRRSTIMNT